MLLPGSAASYAYLCGMYLGDGHITGYRGAYGLHITLDGIYPEIIAACVDAMHRAAPSVSIKTRQRRNSRAVVVYGYSRHWLCLFPQHGPGRKHLRSIALAEWQEVIVARYPVEFLRGLVHSDGCRSVNTVRTASRTYRYTRYFFRNASEDIMGLFGVTCDRLGVKWTRSGPRTISVSKRSSVLQLDEWIGPKR